MYVPAFKCSTNPRIATAHRWNKIDVLGRLSKPTGTCGYVGFVGARLTFFFVFSECFYNKDGVWYYAGSYKAFMLDYLSVKEWEQLPAEVRPFHFPNSILNNFPRIDANIPHQGNPLRTEKHDPTNDL